MDDQNLYRAPQAVVGDRVEDVPEFFVVAPYKFFLLFFFTLGLYQLYWFYMQWARFRRWRKVSLWPAPRALFSIFFMHSLNDEIDGALKRTAPGYRWSPKAMATGYVVFQIAMTACDRMAARDIGSPITDQIGIVLMLPVALFMAATQRAANAACGDPAGAGNARLTLANYAWMVLGGLLWALVIIGLFVDPDSIA